MTELALNGGTPVRTKPFPKWPVFGVPEEQALLRVLHSGKWGKQDGVEVASFEKRFAEYHQAKHGIACVNGTVTLRIAPLAAGIQAGDEVIIPPYTFLATASSVVEANAVPIFVDIDPETFNIDPKQIERAITPRTRAIICVHVGGMPCDMDAIMAIANKHNLIVIEDAAHAHGSEFKGRKVGAIAPLGSFSFQSSKNMTSGEGGIITTNDEALAAKCRSIHNCGRVPGGKWYEHHVISGNYRLNEFAGAILNCQLDRLAEQSEIREANGRLLDEKLAQIPGITPQRRHDFATKNTQHLYVFRFDEKNFGISRTRFLEALAAEGIPAAPGYAIPLYRQPLFVNKAFGPYDSAARFDYASLRLPVCERISNSEGAWLYQTVLLGSRDDTEDVVKAVEKIYQHRHELIAEPVGGGAMIVGASQVEVTPASPLDLSGYAARPQPMTGVLDPLHVKALYLEHAHKKLLWMSLDVLALSHSFVESFRTWARNELNIADILLSATHTHAAPAVVELTGCGRCDAEYLRMLQSRSRDAACEAVNRAEKTQMVFAQTEFPLAIDRRGKPSAHVDSTLSAIGWKRTNGDFVATLINYPMHPVSLGHVNRQISADWPGGAERAMQSLLPGAPIALITNGACGNLNPPVRPVPAEQTYEYGRQVASAIAEKLRTAPPASESLFVLSEFVELPLEALSPDQIDHVAKTQANEFDNTEWSKTFREAIGMWRETQQQLIAADSGKWIDIEIFIVELGPALIVAVSGELFSHFTALLREQIQRLMFVVGYANAVFGYIPNAAAYDEGGYEVEHAHYFYNSFRPARGGLELLAERATELIRSFA